MAWIWVFQPGEGAGRPVPLPEGGLSIGREADNGLVLEDAGISRHHARIFREAGAWVLEDLGSANGSWIGEARVQRRVVRPGEAVRLGGVSLVLAEDAPAEPAPPASIPPPAPTPGRRRRPIVLLAPLALAGLAMAFLVFLALESGDPRLLASQVASIWNNGWSGRLKPARRVDNGVAGLEVQPAPGLRIRAERGALDQARGFRAVPLSAQDGRLLLERAEIPGLLPLGGFQVDAGMGPEDRFVKPVQFSFDLETMKVPEEFRTGLQVIRIEDGGRRERLPVRLEGRNAVVEARHNASFIIAWGPLAILVGLMAFPILSQVEKGAYQNHWWDDVDAHWHVCWPKTMAHRQTPELLRVQGILEERRKFHMEGPMVHPPVVDPRDLERLRLAAWLRDPQVKAASALVSDVGWKIKNFYPAEVAYTVTALRHAAEYLWEVRKFRKRTWGGRIEVWVRQPWSHGIEYALTLDDATTFPNVQVNATKLPAKYPPPPSLRKDIDSLETTLVHEVFHVLQKEYFNTTKYLNPGHLVPGGARYEWFNEATAVMVEDEAGAYYLGRKEPWIGSYEGTFNEFQKHGESLWGHFRRPLDDTGADPSGTRKKGYAASRFLLHLRDTYSAGDRDAFLPRLMETYGSFWTGPIEALVKSTSNSRQVLGLDYLVFSERNAASISCTEPNPASLTLGRGNPIGNWESTGPLSAPALRIGLAAGEDLKKAKLMVRPPKGLGERVAHSWAWSPELRKAGGFQVVRSWPLVKEAQGAGMMLQRVEYDADGPAGKGPDEVKLGAGDDTATTVILLAPPKEPPRIRMNADKKSLHIEIPETPLWRANEVLEFRVRFYGPLSQDRPLPVSLGRGRREADVDLAMLIGTQMADPQSGLMMKKVLQVVSQQDLKDMIAVSEFIQGVQGARNELRVSYAEVVRSDPSLTDDRGIEGPESPVFKVPAEAQPGDLAFTMDGTWKGQIMLVHEPVSLRTGVPGRISLGTETLYFRVSGNAQFGGYALQYLAKEKDTYLPTGITVYAYRLPGRKLWLTVPPSVLYPEGAAKEEDPGWWEYFFGRKARK